MYTRGQAYEKVIECLRAFQASEYEEHPVRVAVHKHVNQDGTEGWIVTTPLVPEVWDGV